MYIPEELLLAPECDNLGWHLVWETDSETKIWGQLQLMQEAHTAVPCAFSAAVLS